MSDEERLARRAGTQVLVRAQESLSAGPYRWVLGSATGRSHVHGVEVMESATSWRPGGVLLTWCGQRLPLVALTRHFHEVVEPIARSETPSCMSCMRTKRALVLRVMTTMTCACSVRGCRDEARACVQCRDAFCPSHMVQNREFHRPGHGCPARLARRAASETQGWSGSVFP